VNVVDELGHKLAFPRLPIVIAGQQREAKLQPPAAAAAHN
jgi:hypothetical protein